MTARGRLASSRLLHTLSKRFLLVLGVVAMCSSYPFFPTIAQVKKKALSQAAAVPTVEEAARLEAVITTDLGTIRFEFFPEKAPKHVLQFIKLAREGFYDGSAFHRVVPRGIIQVGDPLLKNPDTPRQRWGTGGLTQTADELGGVPHVRGTVSTVMIPGRPNSGGSQFFICASPQPQLDANFSAFGQVTEGIEIVDKISLVPVDANQLTVTPIRIVSVKIEAKKEEPFKNATIDELRRDVLLNTSLGELTLEMDPDVAPETVRNFLMLVQSGWYDHTAFHRLIPGFMIQGGLASSRTGQAGHPADRWVHQLKPEFTSRNHVRGVLSMARGEAVDSANTSFFIMLGTAPHLDGKYTIFGKVVGGFDVLDRMEKAPRIGEAPQERIEIIEAAIKPL
jgi:peptidyl-prolyl cis-trans isomerase B (cyclophilin B)